VKSKDEVFTFFYKSYYILFYSCSVGDIPSPKQVYDMPAEKLDEWYRAVWELNPDLLGVYAEDHETAEVEVRTGEKITLHKTHDLPSYVLKMLRLEQESRNDKHPKAEDAFRHYVYPKIAACANGSKIPDVEEAIRYPRVEIAKWSAVAMQLNPTWFQAIYDEAERLEQEKDNLKKKEKSPATS
jgi:hypothetical protein